MFRALFVASLLVTLLVNIVFFLVAREQTSSLNDATVVSATMAASPGWPTLVDSGRSNKRRPMMLADEEVQAGTLDQTGGQQRRRLLGVRTNRAARIQAGPVVLAKENDTRERRWRATGQQQQANLGQQEQQQATREPSLANANNNHHENDLDVGPRLAGPQKSGSDKNLAEHEEARWGERAASSTTATTRAQHRRINDAEREPENAHTRHNNIEPAAASSSSSLHIRVKSSKNHVLISVDNSVVHESGSSTTMATTNSNTVVTNSNSRSAAKHWDEPEQASRGIHVVVLNQFDGSVMAVRTFDTYTAGQDDEMCLFLAQLRPGRLVIFAVEDEASFRMSASSQARKLLGSRAWSSRHIGELRWRDMWALVTKRGDPNKSNSSAINYAECLTRSRAFDRWAPDCELELDVRLDSKAESLECNNENNFNNNDDYDTKRRRREFCARVEGYGLVCDCQHPAPINFAPSTTTLLDQVPVLVIASNRPYYLYRMLRSLLASTGLNSSMVTVFIDGYYEEPVQVAKLFNLRAVQQRPAGRRSARISHHYKRSLALTFEHLHKDAKYALIFEEDLDVARDAIVYFNQTISLLERDPTLYCASAWNDQGYEHSAMDKRRVLRIETMPGLGWLLSRQLFINELEPNWPNIDQAHDWDMWIRTAQVRRGRECLIPEVSRTFHFGSTGTNINSYFQRQYFSKHAFDLMSNVSGEQFSNELKHLDETNYELMIDSLIESAQIIQRPSYITSNSSQITTTTTTNHIAQQNHSSPFKWSHAPPTGAITNTDESYLCSSVLPSFLEQYLLSTTQTNGSLLRPTNNVKPIDTDNEKKTFVIFIKMIEPDDYSNWLKLAHCWHLWDLDARGQHKAMWRLSSPSGHQLFVVGSPASPYSKRHMPAHLEPFDLVETSGGGGSATPKSGGGGGRTAAAAAAA